MNITKTNIDDLNAVISVAITADDYQAKVEKTLKSYQKQANIPGFRKGHVPLSLIKKQYESGAKFEEINNILQDALNKYIADEKLNLLGQPLPKEDNSLDLNATDYTFDFEIGLAPEFTVNLDGQNLTQYNIVVDDAEIDRYIENFRKRYGKLISQEEVAENSNVNGLIEELNEDGSVKEDGINKNTTIQVSTLKGKTNTNKFLGKKVEDVLELKTKSLFEKDSDLAIALGKTLDEVQDLDAPIRFTIKEVSLVEPAALDQELFDKIYGAGAVDSEEAFRARIKSESEKMYKAEADRQLQNDAADVLIESVKFDLPKEFLIKWLKQSNEKINTDEEAEKAYNDSEKGLRYQLIEGKVAEENGVKIELEDIKKEASEMIKTQMAQFGKIDPTDEEVDEIVNKYVLTNQEETRRVMDQALANKMIALYKEKMKVTTKDLNFEEFVKEVTEKK